ncbi:MAG: 4-hydroxythreonine-4-phosphate dehydrogenase PdxA [Gemmatimonadetes bacterium]|nr:4-hydroxythreonine-4-phosphate dehydrogenase PdxA [Gemmatimonadota bacterium]
MKPRIAVTVGDPRGIGPEVVSDVLSDPPAPADFVVIGPGDLIASIPAAEHVEVAGFEGGSLDAESAGRLCGIAIEKAAALALSGEVAAMVTAPVEKRALHLAGFDFPGHTEMLAHLAGGPPVAMMLASDELKVVLASTHLPLKEAIAGLSTEQLIAVGEITLRSLKDLWSIDRPRIAFCAVNPHAGEGGDFGCEDFEIVRPAAEALGAAGPLPADTVFVRATRGEFDAVVAPFHDIGMTAVKMASFGRAVNVTLGLPFIRTSPDHGTAMDIAGRGVADSSSMRKAVELAVTLSGNS